MRKNAMKRYGLAVLLFVLFPLNSPVFGQEQAIPLFSGGTETSGSTGTLRIRVRASDTYAALPAQMTMRRVDPSGATVVAPLVSLQPGWNVFSLPPGRYEYEVQSAGYEPGPSYFSFKEGEFLPSIEVGLNPVTPTPYLSEEAIDTSKPAGMGLVHGFVYDAVSGAPLAGTTVYLEKAGKNALVDEKGYFRLYYPLPAVSFPEALPPLDTLVFQHAGYKTHRITSFAVDGGDPRLIIEMEPGTGETFQEDMSPEELEKLKSTLSSGDTVLQLPDESLSAIPQAQGLVAMDPPDRIRIGTQCTTKTDSK